MLEKIKNKHVKSSRDRFRTNENKVGTETKAGAKLFSGKCFQVLEF